MRTNKTVIIVITAVLLVLSVLFFVVQSDSAEIQMFSVRVSTENGTEQINCFRNGEDDYFVFLPDYADLSSAQLVLNSDNPISIDGRQLENNTVCSAFELNTPYEFTYSVGSRSFNHTITFMQSKGVPTLHIDTQSGNMGYIHYKKGNEEPGTLRLYSDEGELEYSGELMSIGGRGNNTWDNFDKKPYSIKLADSVDLLGMGSAQKWILLANADDPTNLRNKLIMDFADAFGLEYSPDSQWIDLYLNGEYVGLYLLCERNEVHTERVNIDNDNSFLVSQEIESRLISQKYPHVVTEQKQALRVHYPTYPSDESLKEILSIWQSFENAVLSENGVDAVSDRHFTDIIDLNSWARKYLIEEIFANYDACSVSQYFYCDGNESNRKIYAGPVWDYDHTIGSDAVWQISDPRTLVGNQLHLKDGVDTPWFYALYNTDEFYSRVVELYQNEFSPLLQKVLDENIDEYSAFLSEASVMNQVRWSASADVSSEIESIDNYLRERLTFFDDLWINERDYNLVCVDSGFGINYAYFAVFSGETLGELPESLVNVGSQFKGWYYKDTGEPYDSTKVVSEDTDIVGKWEREATVSLDGATKVIIPVGIMGVLFVLLLITDIKRTRTKRMRVDEQT